MDETPIKTLIQNNTLGDPGDIEDNDNDSILSADLGENVAYQSLSESDSDDEFKKITNFSAETAHDILYNQLSFTKIFLDYDLQKELSLEIGVHVSSEHPWKTVKKELLEEYLTESTVETENLRAKLSLFDDNDSVLLVCYFCQPGQDSADQEDGVFIVYDEIESILIATELIKKLEIWKRFKIKRALHKKPSRTILAARSDAIPKVPPRPRISVEIQTSQSLIQRVATLSFRTSCDCRDGYLELRPLQSETFYNVHRRRIDKGIQSAAQRVDCDQQTDPTFPTNAHSQYQYEVLNEGQNFEEDNTRTVEEEGAAVCVSGQEEGHGGDAEKHELLEEEIDDDDNEETETSHSVDVSRPPKPTPSKSIRELVRTLEFNQIDMYQIEYELIGHREIPKFKVPFLEEVFCFADIQRTVNRHVANIEWHPKYPGLFVATYTWQTLSTLVPAKVVDPKVDAINTIILQPNYVFMWSFKQALDYLLSFESPREVATISFHPLDPNILIGGLVNGQVIIWDLTDLLESGRGAADNSSPYRDDMRKFLKWTQHSFRKDVVKRSAISCLEFSQTDRITRIQWLSGNVYLTSEGDIKEVLSEGKEDQQHHRYFATSSMDGTVAFWNLTDGSIPEDKVVIVAPEKMSNKGKAINVKKRVPTPVVEKAPVKSKYAHFDGKFRPQFVVVMQEPVSSFGFNLTRLDKLPDMEREEDEEEGPFHNNLMATSLSGDVMVVQWKNQETDAAAAAAAAAGSNRQDKLLLKPFAAVHDGPVVAMDKNPLIPQLILTIGQTTLAIWRSDFLHGPIYCQQRPSELTDCQWSLTRPSVFFLTRLDGTIEIWDLASSSQDPCLVETMSGGILTTVSQHRLDGDILAIGDHNSNVRIFKLPTTFTKFTAEEKSQFIEQINKEWVRKDKIRRWQEGWLLENNDILAANQMLEKKERDSVPVKSSLLQSTGKSRSKAVKKDDAKKQKTLMEKGELKWEQMNMKRLMQIMITIKGIDPKECEQKTLPIRERAAYNDLKTAAIKREFAKVQSDLAEMRSRILPVKEDIGDRREVVQKLLNDTILAKQFNQEEFDGQMERKLKAMERAPIEYTLTEIKRRGRQTREILNKSSGGNFIHRDMYDLYKKGRNSSSLSFSKSTGTSPDKKMFPRVDSRNTTTTAENKSLSSPQKSL